MSKVTVVGAGAVGATCAETIARRELCNEVVMLDIKEGVSEGKSIDMFQVAPIGLFDTRLNGSTNDYAKTAGSDVVVITSGVPRKGDMSRSDLFAINADIVKNVVQNIVKHSPNAILIIVSNPMDTMTYLTHKVAGLPANRVIGMGGILDSARYKALIANELNCSPKDIQAQLIGAHGDTMVPLPRFTTVSGIPLTHLLSEVKITEIIEGTRNGGKKITMLLGTSAWYAPGAAAAQMVESIMRDQKRIFPCCVMLDGQYGQKDICLGNPVVLGKGGVEKIIELKLDDAEKAVYTKSADAVRADNALIKV